MVKLEKLKQDIVFPTVIHSFILEDFIDFNEDLKQKIYTLQKQNEGVVLSNVMGWHSKENLFKLVEFAELKKIIDAAIHKTTEMVGYKNLNIIPTSCWANINPQYGSNKIHDHANSLFSGVYYIQTPENSGDLTFYDPREAKTFYKPPLKEYNQYSADAVKFKPVPGLLLVFPSWLKHGVDPNMSSEERISISFNYNFA